MTSINMNDAHDPAIESASCIICGQYHDRSFLRALEQTYKSPKRHSPITAIIVLIVPLIFFAFAVISPNAMIRPRQCAEREAINNLRTIGQAEASFYSDKSRYGTFADLVAAQELTGEWREAAVRGGYRFTIKLYRYGVAVSASPEKYGGDLLRSFQLYAGSEEDSDNFAVHGADRLGEKATRLDPVIEF